MFNFFRKKQPQSEGYFPIVFDMHSHILPGIDDGSPDVETSLRLVKGLMDLGVNQSVATPHIISDLYRNTPASIGASLKKLQDALLEAEMDFKVNAAAEYMIDSYFFELLESGVPLLTIKDNLVLTEFSFAFMPDSPKKVSFNIITGGYSPILAHPERYAYYHPDYESYHALEDMGFKLQVNLLSLTGYYGVPVAKAARYILKNGLASFIGTDLHHDRHLAALKDPNNHRIFSDVLKGAKWNDSLI
jgi:protein-tyrosine phosphatase